MQTTYTLFGQRLVEKGIIKQQQLDEAIHKQQTTMAHRKIGEILVRLNYISKHHVTEGLADQLGIPIVKLADREIPERIRGLIDGSIATLYRVIPIEERGHTIVIATADPSISIDQMDKDGFSSTGDGTEDADDNSPVMRYVNQMILEAFRLRASDIHVEPSKTDVKVRYRIDGVMQLMPPPPKRAQASIISRLKIMAGMDITLKRIPQDGRIKMMMSGKAIDLRVSALPAYYGESMVMRILDKSGLLLGLGQLGFSPEHQRRWEQLLGLSTGVILVTGPTGSGKTTSLYASLHTLNKPDTKIITVEDPVEYQLAGINQVQINHEIAFDFQRALRAIMRQDPNIVMVGEIRDSETAEIAIKAALTGHLVFSTLHTNDTASSFTRLIDIGIKPYLVSSGVRAILAQRLVRTICTNCKESCAADPLEVKRLGFEVDLSEVELYHGAGCDNCNNTGHAGRLGAYELMVNTDRLREMLMNHESATAIKRAAREQGMLTMREDAWKKALNGITTIQEVNRRTRVDEPLEKLVRT
jgi:type II secretory ATPase GspE/PulE/Tfp pilus assembly ATPase PilB-like protein